jgi:hypothetical protein
MCYIDGMIVAGWVASTAGTAERFEMRYDAKNRGTRPAGALLARGVFASLLVATAVSIAAASVDWKVAGPVALLGGPVIGTLLSPLVVLCCGRNLLCNRLVAASTGCCVVALVLCYTLPDRFLYAVLGYAGFFVPMLWAAPAEPSPDASKCAT